jgi:TadE-like protein
MKKFFNRHPLFHPKADGSRWRGQSFVELALVLPILIILLLGLVEITLFLGRYLDALDLTREAARFASARDSRPEIQAQIADVDCSAPEPFNFYWHTACIFSPPQTDDQCMDCAGFDVGDVGRPAHCKFCNGLNPFVEMKPETDDVLISVFTVVNRQSSSESPVTVWALSNNDLDSGHSNNWKYDCSGDQDAANIVQPEPYYTEARMASLLGVGANTPTPASRPNRGFVAVEFYYCYEQVLNIPFITVFIPNPMRLHAYTIMPLPAAAPTPTPKP